MDVDKPQRLPLHDMSLNEQTWALQQVSILATRKTIIAWMLEDEALQGVCSLLACVVPIFLEHFQERRTANLIKADRRWRFREQFFHEGVENQNPTISTSKS